MCVCVCMISLFITVKNEKLTPSGKNIMAFYVENSDGEYVEREEKVFPTTGYVLNLEKSYCTNGGTLSQDSATKKISMASSSPDVCKLYFSIDVNKKPIIKEVHLSAPEGDLARLDSVIMEEEVLIKEYYLSIAGGDYKLIQIKDYLSYNFCDHGQNTAKVMDFSMYVVTEEGVSSDVFNFTYGGFDCLSNISASLSGSQSDFISVSIFNSNSEAAGVPDDE